VAGSVAGMFSVIFCHPLDSLRTKMQASKTADFKTIVLNKCNSSRLLSLYKGVIPPLLAQSAYKSTIFTTNNLCNKYVFESKTSTFSTLFSGLVSGSVNSILVAPIELVRSRQILTSVGCSSISIGDCIKFIVKEEGVLSLWRTLPLTIIRDGPGVSIYLYTFSVMKSYISERKQTLSLLDRIISGSMAGVAFWAYALPVDSLKTLVESKRLLSESSKKSSIIETVLSIYKEFGLYHLYRSWPVALARGIPGAAITLTTYDAILDFLDEQTNS